MELGIYTFAELTSDLSGGPTITARERLRNPIEEIERVDQVGLDVFGVGVESVRNQRRKCSAGLNLLSRSPISLRHQVSRRLRA
ncbi:MAG: hypothetical protein QOI84_1762 [Solirubrobacterales bacterium]|nr:hypothetical protein [Solirubrobacterales bacterium]